MTTCVALGLAACAPPPPAPNSAEGVGFGTAEDFALQRARRDAQLERSEGAGFVPAPQVSAETLPAQSQQGIASSELAAAGIGGTQPTTETGAPLSALGPQSGTGSAPDQNVEMQIVSSGISDEQDFDAVSSRESIESDAERRAAQIAAREVIEPTAVPERPANTGPNIVEYALNAPNNRGQEWYSRTIFSTVSRMQANCTDYRNPDEAQRDFLIRGGPERDPRSLDPDGDGFACGWDPAPFRAAAGN